MLFNSLVFPLFFAVVLAGFCLAPQRHRTLVLFAASCLFYAWWRVDYLGLLLGTSLLDWCVGLGLGRLQGRRGARRALLATSLTANLGVLFAFKYYAFVGANLAGLGAWLGVPLHLPAINVLLPVGISFYTFQSMSYTIDVYRGVLAPERDPLRFLAFISFFPQLVAGPIERAGHVLPQLHALTAPTYRRLVDGGLLMLWGFFKKLVIADRLAIYVDQVYADPGGQPASHLVLAAYLFAFQIYCDFSAYSDIARGAARCFGVQLMVNFRRPYAAASLGDFWRRWHISLSTWFRDYLYIPLGGGRVPALRAAANIMVVFLASGVWHGAAWTFVVWGGIHGAVLVVERFAGRHAPGPWARLPPALRAGLGWALTFHVVVVAWVFFRATTLAQAMTIFHGMGHGLAAPLEIPGFTRTDLVIGLAGVALVDLVERWHERGELVGFLARRPRPLRWSLYAGLLVGMVFCGVFSARQFIYFQF